MTNHKTVFLIGSGDLQSSSHWFGQLGCFLSSQCWFVPVGITEAKNSTLGEKEHNVLSLYGFCTGCPNLMLRGL